MKKFILLISIILIFYTINCYGQFNIHYNKKTGAIQTIVNPEDPYKMNWILSSSDSLPTWQISEQDWGLGKYVIDNSGEEEKWTHPVKQKISENTSAFLYKTKDLEILVERRLVKKDYRETYTFTNKTGKRIHITKLGIYTPFNDNYQDARTCETNRCNAHIWPGMYSSYVNAIRMGGSSPHLGLVFTKGAMKSYSIENRGKKGGSKAYERSNVRGTILLDMAPFYLDPGEQYIVQWRLFWHNGWKDFFKKAKKLGFVRLSADKYMISKGANESLHITVNTNRKAGIRNKNIVISPDSLGEHSKKVYYDKGKKMTLLNYLVISSAGHLIDKRVHFIVNHQQMNDPQDIRYGAYMVYDNEGDSIFTDPSHSVNPVDRNAGRERLGMGVLIAKWLQNHHDPKVYHSLMRYVKFVKEKLQDSNYHVYSSADHKANWNRGYNYPWVANLYLQVFHLTGKVSYLEDYYFTMEKFFKYFGHQFYAIDIRVKDGITSLKDAGLTTKADSLLKNFILMGNRLVKNGIYYPKSEVNYEQGIVAPSVQFLCELYLLTEDGKYLRGAKEQLSSLIAFCGRQPDVHLNWIAIRHWDDYWFGKKEMWGDTMPHYWSTLTATAFLRYYECTGDSSYLKKAKRIVENNLLNFKEDGRASCAYLYPASVDRRRGKFYDPFANDQDWALVFYMEVMKNY